MARIARSAPLADLKLWIINNSQSENPARGARSALYPEYLSGPLKIVREKQGFPQYIVYKIAEMHKIRVLVLLWKKDGLSADIQSKKA